MRRLREEPGSAEPDELRRPPPPAPAESPGSNPNPEFILLLESQKDNLAMTMKTMMDGFAKDRENADKLRREEHGRALCYHFY